MIKRYRLLALPSSILLFTLTLLPPIAVAQQHRDVNRGALSQRAQSALAGSFVENRGQWPRNVRYVARRGGLDLWVTDRGVTYDFYRISSSGASTIPAAASFAPPDVRRSGQRVRMEFVGGTARSTVSGVQRLPGTINFISGRDPKAWHTGISHYAEARIDGIYPGIGARLYSENGTPRYDLSLAPGADPRAVRMRFAGAESVRTTAAGELEITTKLGVITQRGLLAYQQMGTSRVPVACAFNVSADGTVGFTVPHYDRSRALVIDPLVYSTYLGGSGDDAALSLAIDDGGNAYLTGYALMWLAPPSDQFPTTTGAYDRTYNGGVQDVYVTKFDCKSDTLVYSTLIGGTSYEEGTSIVVDPAHNAIVCGNTGSSDFPTTAGSLMPTYAGGQADAFAFKLNSTGSALVFSTYIGGGIADGANALALAADGSIRICGHTASADFPVRNGAYDMTFNGQPGDIFVATLNSTGTTLPSCTFVGGNNSDAPLAIALDASSNAIITGITSSTDFPTSGGAYDPTYNTGINDAFLIKVSAGNDALLSSTYIGGTGEDQANDVESSGSNTATICGQTSSHDFPTTPGAYQTAYRGGAYDMFVARFNFNTNAFDFSTLVGTGSDEYGMALAIDASGNTYVTGNSISDSFPTTLDAYDRINKHNSFDAFITELNPSGSAIVYSTFIGGSDRDVPYDIKLRGTDVAFICGTTRSVDYPTGPLRWSDSLGRVRNGNEVTFSYDAFLTKFKMRGIAITDPPSSRLACRGSSVVIQWYAPRVPQASVDRSDSTGKSEWTRIASGVGTGTFTWQIPNDLPAGTYRIRVSDPSDASVVDTSVNLVVPPKPAFTTSPQGATPCPGEPVTLSAAVQGMGLHYQWRRRGTDIPGATSTQYKINAATPADSGLYELTATDTCGVAITASAQVGLQPGPAVVTPPANDSVCVGQPFSFSVVTAGGTPSYQWLRNGTPIAGATSATYTVASAAAGDAGTYTVSITSPPCESKPLVTSPVTLTVGQITITTQPTPQTVAEGSGVTLTVAATGTGLTYQWRKDGVPIPGATAASYTISSVTFGNAGVYDVVIGGPCTMTSNGARIDVTTGGVPLGNHRENASLALAVAPNPSSGMTHISIADPAAARRGAAIRLVVHDLTGREVLDLTKELMAGDYRAVEFDARRLPSGVYYCRLVGDVAGGPGTRLVVAR